MRTDTPQTIHRADYQPLSWNVTHVDLHFALDPAATLVTSRLTLTRNPQALTLATTELAGPLAGWWRRRRVRRDAHRVGITALLERPFQPRQVSAWLDLI